MSIRVGIDLVSPEEVAESVKVHGRRYLERVYTDEELRQCSSDVRCLAARFAAKEATIKALGRNDEPLPWRSIGVHLDASGRPSIELTGTAAVLARRRGVRRLAVSFTHERSVAGAIVLAELEPRARA